MRIPFPSMPAAVCVAVAVCSGCALEPQRNPDYAGVRPAPVTASPQPTGSIYSAAQAVALFEDVRARRVGDIMTVRLIERTNASKKASTTTKKENEVDIAAPNLLGSAVQFNAPGFIPLASNRNNTLSASLDSSQKFTGEGDSSQANSLSGSITVTVVEVLANGNLVVRGEKLLALNQGHEYVRLSGVVRPADILADNSVSSTQVADAQISYGGRGAVADANANGWLARFFNSAFWPF